MAGRRVLYHWTIPRLDHFQIPSKKLKARGNLATEALRQYLPAPREVQMSGARGEVNPSRACSPVAELPDGPGMSPRWPGFPREPTFSSPGPFPNPAHSVGREAETSAPPEDKSETMHREGRGRVKCPDTHLAIIVTKTWMDIQSRMALAPTA